jgi:hypothetical protein
MDIANKWADGEDAVYNKRARSPEEDRNRNNNQSRRRFRSLCGIRLSQPSFDWLTQ